MDATTLMMKLASIGPHAVAYMACGDVQPGPAVHMTFNIVVLSERAPAGFAAFSGARPYTLEDACAFFSADPELAPRCLAAFALMEKAKPEEGGVPASWMDGLASGLLETARATPEHAQRLRDALERARDSQMMDILDGSNPFIDSHLDGVNPLQLHMGTNVTLAILILIANARGVLDMPLGQAHKTFFESISSPALRELVDWSSKPRRERLQELMDNPANIKMGIAVAGFVLLDQPTGPSGIAELTQFIHTAADADGPRTPAVDDAVAMALELLTKMGSAEAEPIDLSGENRTHVHGMAEVPLGVYMHLASARGDNSKKMVLILKEFLEEPGNPLLKAIFSAHPLPVGVRMQNLMDNQKLIGPTFAMMSMFLRKRDDGEAAADAIRAYIDRMADAEGAHTPQVTSALETLAKFMSLMP